MMKETFLSAILILAVVVPAGPVKAAESGVGLYNLGNRHYSEERYDEAMKAYLGALEPGIENVALLYNLGNATLKTGRLGEAILYYERGTELDPKDEEWQAPDGAQTLDGQFYFLAVKPGDDLAPLMQPNHGQPDHESRISNHE